MSLRALWSRLVARAAPAATRGAPPEVVDGLAIDPATVPAEPLCVSPWKQFLVRPSGDVWPCCFWYTEESLGNLGRQSFEEIWNGPAYRRLRWQLLTGELGTNCSRCPVPGIGDVNDERRHHGNFGAAKKLAGDQTPR